MLCGGGHQYATLLGRYQALIDQGKQPDLLIASCGGSIIANLICSIADPQQRLDWLSSKEMYQFWQSQVPGPGNQLHNVLLGVLKRKFRINSTKYLPDLFSTWLFEFENPFPALPQRLPNAPDTLMIGTQVNYSQKDVGLPNKTALLSESLFSEVLFCNERIGDLLRNEQSSMANHSEKISTELVIKHSVSELTAMRVSVADCYYYQPVEMDGKQYIGGLMNLFPIELAKRCAVEVISERKPNFDRMFAAPAIQHVFGFDPQYRLDQYHDHDDVTWLSKISTVGNTSISKKINGLKNQLQLSVGSYDEFKQQVIDQYQAGYRA